MTCKNCGKELSPEKKNCDNCGATVENVMPEEEAQIPETSVEAPVADTPSEEALGEISPEEKAPKNRKKGLWVGICVAAVVIAAAVIAFPLIKNFFAKTFSPNDVYLKNVERASMEEAVDVVALVLDTYSSLMPEETDSLLPFYNSKKADVDLSVKLSDAIVNYISEAAYMDLSFLKSIDLGYYYAFKDDDIGLGINLGLENKQLISANAIFNLKDLIAYLTLPELSDTAMRLDLEALTGEDLSGISKDEYTSALSNALAIYSSIPEGKTVKSIVMRYVDTMLEQIETVEKNTETVKVGTISKKYTALTTVFTPDDLEELSVAFITKLKDDDELWEMLENFSPEEAEDIRYSRYELIENYDSMVSDVDGTFDNIGNLTYTAYVNSKGSVIGRSFVYEDGSTFSLIMAENGKDSAFEMEIKDMGLDIMNLVANTTESGDSCYGNAVINVEGMDALNIKFEDVKLDGTSAKITFTPMEAISGMLEDTGYELESEMGVELEALGIDLTKSEITLRFETDITEELTGNVNYEIALISNGIPAISAEIKIGSDNIDGFELPDEYKEVDGEMGLISWLSTVDIIGFIETLPDALSGVIMNSFMSELS